MTENTTPILAYFDSSHDCPEELIMAAGFHPYKILGDVHTSTDLGDQYLSNFFCPAARSMLSDALINAAKWQGIVVAHGCDATNRHFDVWKKHVPTPFIYWVNSPLNMNETGKKFFKVELKRMAKTLEDQFQIDITPAKIESAIQESNTLKKLMQSLATLRATKDISNREYFTMCQKSVQQDKKSLFSELKTLLKDWQERAPFPSSKKKIFLTGSDITYGEWMDLLDECNLRVVRDDLSIGERYFATLISENMGNDVLDRLIEYYFTIPRPATKNPPDLRASYILEGMKSNNLAGVLSQNLKFCEPYAFDSVYTVQQVKDAGYQIMHLEREFTADIDHQLKTRIEAFGEML
ncbi:hypothetical protein NEF87_003286 [Candidatus Lokiarchaeum ossiferum]|uniref:2-hydroxyacyl-CoA dehydratase n=1 Tax=Candidatus Lokiarchaeum ossiferum TaxID=2951803 RepID=A0ABY6HUA9_9ARCH|nr:hypothetical protein NEF87_003286 [Candidatus Lokiarchaeum sp. B-35]